MKTIKLIWYYLDSVLIKHKWYRAILGGHWENWYIDYPIATPMWIQVDECSNKTGKRPVSPARGTCKCEDYN